MEQENPVHLGTERALFLLTEKRSEAVFNDLLDYASEVCLRKPPEYLEEAMVSKFEAVNTEDRIVQQLGARALTTLIELQAGMHKPTGDPSQSFFMTEILEHPREFSGQANLRILENAERFGQALIDESFAILGKDAPSQVEKLKQASTHEEELGVLSWLNLRIQKICEKSRSDSSEEDENSHFYPPYRISPKFIGSYPKPDVQPSCLSAAVMATSFFEKADYTVLNAGVNSSASQAGPEILLKLASSALLNNKENLSDDMARGIATLASNTMRWLERPVAQHSAVYVKLLSGWVQFDPYLDATVIIDSSESGQLDSVQAALQEWRSIVPNLEFTTPATSNLYVGTEADLSFLFESYKYDDPEQMVESISDALRVIPDEAHQSYLYDACLRPLMDPALFPGIEDDVVSLVLNDAETARVQPDGRIDSRMRRMFNAALNTFIYNGDSPEEFIKRCTTDIEYRRRRAEDILQLPMMLAILNAQLMAQSDPGYAHLSVDIGNPAMRIGLSALSDFALYDNYPLPASFWVTHWPGSISAVENIDNPPASDSDWKLTYNALLSKMAHPFTSLYNYDKISSFMSTASKVDKDGNRQEGPR